MGYCGVDDIELKIMEIDNYNLRCRVLGLKPVDIDIIGSELIVSGVDRSIKTCVIPTFVDKIGSCAFKDMERLERVDIPDNVKAIGSNAFYYCANLSEVNLGVGVECIGN